MHKKTGTRGILKSDRVAAYCETQVEFKFGSDYYDYICNTDLLTFHSFLILYCQPFSNKIFLRILSLSIPFFDTVISEECSQGPL